MIKAKDLKEFYAEECWNRFQNLEAQFKVSVIACLLTIVFISMNWSVLPNFRDQFHSNIVDYSVSFKV